jgi:hypothetical protein
VFSVAQIQRLILSLDDTMLDWMKFTEARVWYRFHDVRSLLRHAFGHATMILLPFRQRRRRTTEGDTKQARGSRHID